VKRARRRFRPGRPYTAYLPLRLGTMSEEEFRCSLVATPCSSTSSKALATPADTMGTSSNVLARLAWHNEGLSRHTAKHRPWKLLVSIEFTDEPRAMGFEKYLKSGSGRAFAKRHFG
jgi:putative endonuclease